MILSIWKYNNNQINDGTNFQAFFPEQSVMLQQPSEALENLRPDATPLYSGQVIPEGHTIPIVIKMLGTIHSQIDTLKGYFNTHDPELHKLICKDTADSDKQWYVYAKPIRMVDLEGQSVTIILSVPDPIWREQTESSDIWLLSATGQTQAITVAGNVNTQPRFVLSPTSQGTAGFGYKRYVRVYNKTRRLLNNYPIEITGIFDTDALVTAGKMQADGDDLRVVVDGKEVPRWIHGINTTQTKVWINTVLHPKNEMVLLTALGTGAETEIAIKDDGINKDAIERMPKKGVVMIGSEMFYYDEKDNEELLFYIDKRAINQSSTAAHAAASTVRWIEHAIWLCYGNPTMDDPVETEMSPDVFSVSTYDRYKPIFNLTSTNTLWDYDEFTDKHGRRSGSWRPAVQITNNTRDHDHPTEFYEAAEGTHRNTATEMGMAIRSWKTGSGWKPENGKVFWQLYHPCGVWKVSATGYKYRTNSSWPTNCHLWANDRGTGSYFKSMWATEASPTTAATWTAWTKNNQALGDDYLYLRYTFAGTLTGTANNLAAVEVSDITLSLTTGAVPSVTMASETSSTQFLRARIKNTTTNKWISIKANLKLFETVTIDCDNKLVYDSNGENLISGLKVSTVRKDWLDLEPGSNVLAYYLTNTGNVTLLTYWRDRNS